MKAKIVLSIFAIALVLQVGARVWTAHADPTYPQSTLSIEGPGGIKHDFTVEIARTPEQMEHGLMYRQALADNAGMLFVFPAAQDAAMWMKNTVISLDMVFIHDDGTIARIEERATPQSTAIIAAGSPVRAVLELQGGATERNGIKAGDKVDSPELAQP